MWCDCKKCFIKPIVSSQVYYLPGLVFGNNYLPSVLGSLPWFRRIFLREKIQIVHCHSTFSTMAHEALLHARTLNLRTVFTDHSLFGFADASAILSNKLVLRYSLSNADRLVCVSHTRFILPFFLWIKIKRLRIKLKAKRTPSFEPAYFLRGFLSSQTPSIHAFSHRISSSSMLLDQQQWLSLVGWCIGKAPIY